MTLFFNRKKQKNKDFVLISQKHCLCNMHKKIRPLKRTVLTFLSLRSCYKVRTEATRANIHTLMCAVYNCLYLSDVRLPSAIGLSVRVRNLQTESNALTADFTFCHFADTSYYKAVLQNGIRFFINICNYTITLQ